MRWGIYPRYNTRGVTTSLRNTHMSSEKSVGTEDLAEKGLWAALIVVGGVCLVTMVLVPLLALTAGGYLAVTGQYLLATAIVLLGFGLAYALYRRRENTISNY